ncbi:DNA-directed RNA polymerase subunit beta', partial [candidate division WWE3 bacterium]|nr:DNA-directed RNA polymerase subunit beta' [candidate division WWE3 bacterium]
MIDLNNFKFDALKVSLASPEEIKSWSYGEVTKAETINYRTLKPEKGGLFDERIFGPTKDLECYCGKYKRQRYKGVVCDKCGVEVTYSRVRRERMGHIELAAPVVHTWFFKRSPNKLPAILDIGLRDLESVIYFAQFLVTNIDEDQRAAIIERLDKEVEQKKSGIEAETNEKIANLQAESDKKVEELKAKKDQTEADELKIDDIVKNTKRQILYLREELINNQDNIEDSLKQVKERVNGITRFSVVSEAEMAELSFWDADDFFEYGMGAEIIAQALSMVDLDEEIEALNEVIKGKSKTRRQKAIKRLRIIQGLKDAKINPGWMIMDVLPVIPPELRPIVQLPGGRFATSDLNDLYRRVINRNNRLKDLIQLGAPNIILQNEKRMLQEAIDSLIEGSKKVTRGRKELQSLSDMLKGKQGRFRQNLLGKRVDYSGRSVIVVGPNLRMNQVGLPKEVALELFKPFVLRDLIFEGYAPNLKSAKHVLEARGDEVWDILERVTHDHPVLLNRAPTLHRQNIQAFYPVLIEGKAITFHPAIVGSFAGDFDGDQMAVHVPLSKEAVREAKEKLLAPHNILKLAHGKPIFDLKHDLSLGLYYMTMVFEELDEKSITFVFTDPASAVSAYHNKKISLHQQIKVAVDNELQVTTVGRLMFNE